MDETLRQRIVNSWRTHTGKFLYAVLMCAAAAIAIVIWLASAQHYETLKAIGGALVGLIGTALGAVFAFWFASSVSEKQARLNERTAQERLAVNSKQHVNPWPLNYTVSSQAT